MPKEQNEVKSHVVWLISIAGILAGLLITVYNVGWKARGQTAAITAVEVKTDAVRKEFDSHCEEQKEMGKEISKTLNSLDKHQEAQMIILGSISEDIERLEKKSP